MPGYGDSQWSGSVKFTEAYSNMCQSTFIIFREGSIGNLILRERFFLRNSQVGLVFAINTKASSAYFAMRLMSMRKKYFSKALAVSYSLSFSCSLTW